MKAKHWILAAVLVPVVGVGILGYLAFMAPSDAGGAATGTEETAAAACEEHGVESCPFCSPEVIEQMGFCDGHGVPEAICTKCRDDLEAAFRAENDWCDGHGLPESQCESCNPGVLDQWKGFGVVEEAEERSAGAGVGSDGSGIEVREEAVARIHRQPALNCETEQSLIRLSSESVARDAGLGFARVDKRKLRKSLEAPAEVDYDARRYARLAPRAPGIVSEVRCDLGQPLQAGDVVAVVDSAVLGTAKSDLLQAAARAELWEQNSARESRLLEKNLATQRDALEAETRMLESRIALQAAEQRLRNFGLDEAEIEEVRRRGDTSSILLVKTPFAGVVVGLEAVVGERADEDSILVSVADTTRMWAMLDVDAGAARQVETGQVVLLTMDGWEDQTLGGVVTWISTSLDPRTRTIKVRAELDNADGALRAGGFGTARIVTRDDDQAVLVPKSAVQWEGCCNVVFVRRSSTEFLPRKLLLGYDAGDHYEVLRGLTGGEEVVTDGSFLLKTELEKESIGAGCCEVDYLSKN